MKYWYKVGGTSYSLNQTEPTTIKTPWTLLYCLDQPLHIIHAEEEALKHIEANIDTWLLGSPKDAPGSL